MSRYKKLEGVTIGESKEVFFFELYINPFQIESFYETEIEFTNEDEMRVVRMCCFLITKSGERHHVMGTAKQLIKQLEC